VVELSWDQVAAWRMRRHGLVERAPASALLEVAGRIAGLHAQVMSSAGLAASARLEGLSPGAVDRLLWDERALVKTWAVRGTLHLLPATDYPQWQAALSTYQHYLKGAWFRAFGVDREELERLLAAIAEALDGEPLTREELAVAVAKLTGSDDLGNKLRESWGAMLKPASFRGHLVFAPSDGQQVRFTRPDRWLGPWKPEDPEEAVAAVARRFLAVSGPATREGYGRWWAISPAAAQRLFQRLGDAATQVDLEGARAWVLTEHLEELAQATPPRCVRLLPAFDQYVVAASQHAEELMPGPFRERVWRPQGWLSPVLLVDGRMEGVWRHERKGDRLTVTVEPFTDLPAWVRRAAADEAERLAAFLGGGLDLRWSTGG
jgi:hypothetical protein